jgi:hypothetical protein
MAVRLIDQFSKAETAKDPKVAKRMAELRELILPLKRRWDRTSAGRKFKELLQQADDSSAAP